MTSSTRRRRNRLRQGFAALTLLLLLSGLGWGATRLYRQWNAPAPLNIPSARVKQGDVSLDVHAQGTLKGGSSEMLVAPPVAGGPLSIKFLRDAGDPVKPGDEIVAFDTSSQEYNLTQAHQALDQAAQQVVQAQASAAAQTEDDTYQIAKAGFDVKRAELQVRRNPTLAAVDAQKNDLVLAAAQEHLRQLQQDVEHREASNAAAIALQKAAQAKAQADSTTAEHNIGSMSLKAQRPGYVSLQQNTSTNMFYSGMQLPPYQIGDTARPGQAVAEVPDNSAWEVNINVSELDAGHLTTGQPVQVEFVAFPGQTFDGKLLSVGATNGPAWNRQVACVVALPQGGAELHPGLSANVIITTETVRNALWAPSQAVFDAGGRSYVYLQSSGHFVRHDVKVVRRNESQVVLEGLRSGDEIALSDPEQAALAKSKSAGGAAAAVGGGRGK